MQLPHRKSVLKGPDGNGNGTADSMTQQPPSSGPSPNSSPSPQAPQTTATTSDEQHPPPPDLAPEDMPPVEPAMMHFPHCRLEITTLHGLPASPTGAPSKLEQVALPGALVRTLLSRFESDMLQQTSTSTQTHDLSAPLQQLQQTSQHLTPPPPPPRAAAAAPPAAPGPPPPAAAAQQKQPQHKRKQRRVRIQPHPDDAHDWVFSRCLLADFTSLRDDEAEALSAQGRLCCWASVVLRPVGEFYGGEGEGEWDGEGEGWGGCGEGRRLDDGEDEEEEEEWWELGFVVHHVGVRDPRGGWCGCF